MEKYDVKFKKKFGQNFLKDINIVKRIVDVSNIDKDSLVIEVGPGGGVMTRELASRAKQVIAYEIDHDLEDELLKRLDGFDNVLILFQDFLTSDLISDVSNCEYKELYFVSNVPYYITTPILLKIIESGLNFNKIVMMVQKEVGDRFTTLPGSREYGSITVLLNYFYDIKKELDSLIVSFEEKKERLELNDFKFFEKLVRDSFQFKRKTLRNNLKNYDLKKVESVLKEYGYDLSVRAENLSTEIFVKISNELRK